jgi:hypothetical protein
MQEKFIILQSVSKLEDVQVKNSNGKDEMLKSKKLKHEV